MGAAKGIWQSILYSAIGGYILLLCVVFAVPDLPDGSPDNAVGASGVAPHLQLSPGSNWAGVVLFISAAGQLFCAVSCMTSASRMTYAFSRDRAVPGSKHWSTLSANRVPRERSHASSRVAAAIVTLPALIEVNIGTEEATAHLAGRVLRGHLHRRGWSLPVLRNPDLPALGHGDKFEVGAWNNGAEVQVDEPDRGGRDRHRRRCT